MSSQKNARLQRELGMFSDSPPYGISCWSKEGSLQHLEARTSSIKLQWTRHNPTLAPPQGGGFPDIYIHTVSGKKWNQ